MPGLAYGQASALLTDDHCQAAVKHVLDCLATKGGQMLAQQSGECMGVLLAQLHAKSKQNLQVALDRGPEELEKEIRRILLEAQAKGQHDRCNTTGLCHHRSLCDTLTGMHQTVAAMPTTAKTQSTTGCTLHCLWNVSGLLFGPVDGLDCLAVFYQTLLDILRTARACLKACKQGAAVPTVALALSEPH